MNNWKVLIGAAFLLAGCVLMLPYGDLMLEGNVPAFLMGAGVACVGFLLVWSAKSIDVVWFWAVAIGARCLLLMMEPGDDLWRYLWEGEIQLHGFSPYLYAPDVPELEGLRRDWWGHINNPSVSAIYPPLLQLCLRFISGTLGTVLGMKFIFVLADLALCFLLVRRFGRVKGLIYAWNPLVIYAIAGGGHFDSLFLLPLVAGWILWEKAVDEDTVGETWRLFAAALFVGVSVAIKLVSLPVLAWMGWKFLRRGMWKQMIIVSIAGSAPFLLSWGLMGMLLGEVGPLLPSEFTLKARSCEVVPWLVGLIWPVASESNGWIAIVFTLVVFGQIFWIQKFRIFVEYLLVAFFILGPVNHAWYFIWLIPFAVASGNWGTRLLSVSGFVYFWLQHTNVVSGVWEQSIYERMLLWVPFFLGWIFFLARERKELMLDKGEVHV
jgi:alpha-1,6-mannosyltransferase